MADTADVERALAAACAGVLFPAGGYAYGAVAASGVQVAATPLPCRLYRGWPATDTLNGDLAKGIAHVSVYPEAGMGRNTTRYLTKWWQAAQAAPTLAGLVAQGAGSATVTWSGTAAAGQIAGVALGSGQVPATYAYAVQAADTPASVAAALAAMINGATASGAVLTVPDPSCLSRVVQGTTAMWLARQISQRYRVNIWCPSPQARDALAAAIDLALAQTFRLPMPDGSPALLRYGGTLVSDLPARQGEWNRSLAMLVEYSTAPVVNLPAVLFPAGSVNGAPFGAMPDPVPLIYTDLAGNVLVDLGGNPVGGSGAVSAAGAAAPGGGFVTTAGAVLVDIFGNPVVGP
jgi:hypothetical protein